MTAASRCCAKNGMGLSIAIISRYVYQFIDKASKSESVQELEHVGENLSTSGKNIKMIDLPCLNFVKFDFVPLKLVLQN